MKRTKTALVIFAREPKDGKVKTRLSRDMPVAAVTRIYKAFIKDVLAVGLRARCDGRFLYYAGTGSSIPFLRRFEKKFSLRRQTGCDLGARMHRAFVRCQREGFKRVIIVGTDCLTMTARDIEQALVQLESHDCVLGPSKDGGYYLIGLSAPCAGIFKGIAWGTSCVFARTIKKVRHSKKSIARLPIREDVDTINHLRTLSRKIKNTATAVHTQKILRNFTS